MEFSYSFIYLLYMKPTYNRLKTLQNKTMHRPWVHWQLQGKLSFCPDRISQPWNFHGLVWSSLHRIPWSLHRKHFHGSSILVKTWKLHAESMGFHVKYSTGLPWNTTFSMVIPFLLSYRLTGRISWPEFYWHSACFVWSLWDSWASCFNS